MTGVRRRAAALLVIAATGVGIAACGSDGPDVMAERATMHTDGAVPDATTGAATDDSGAPPASTVPPETTEAPPTSEATDTTEPTDTTDAPTATTESSEGTVFTIPVGTTGDTGPTEGSGTGDGVGDTLFPDLGNPGIDVDHYDVDLAYDHDTGTISGTVTLDITATADLDDMTLDAVGLDVESVTVDGATATFTEDDPELRITPSAGISSGATFEVAVTYSAEDIDDQVSPGVTAGWFHTEDGSFVLNEPDGARHWMPSNDHPSDKATYHFLVHVAPGLTAAANGELVDHETDADGETWEWRQDDPQTTYVIQLMTGHLTVFDAVGPHSLPLVNVLQDGDEKLMQPFIDDTAEQIAFFEGFFGPFPFESYGISMTDGYIGGAMEEQGRSLFSVEDFLSGDGEGPALLLSHELTHQWYGDAVSPADWQDIWLNESFATYGEWMWLEHEGYRTVEESAQTALGQRQHSAYATGTPDIPGLFGFEVYEGGACVLQALRATVGDDTFFEILKTWVQSNVGESRTSQDFIELSSKLAGEDLTDFFDTWLYSVNLPKDFP